MHYILRGLLVLFLFTQAQGVDDEKALTAARSLSTQLAQDLDFTATQATEGRLEKRQILALFDFYQLGDLPAGIRPGTYMCAYGHTLMDEQRRGYQESRFYDAGIWYHRAACRGYKEAQGIFKRKNISLTQDEDTCAQAFATYWLNRRK